ncbi:MAG: LysR family transcriptional regulator [Ruminiclostridium sp.]|nr:LysR family transcriptional regulator [Ruminiclostridium sp.]
MNIVHLKYAIEVEKAKSINKAAEKLYMGQPNLSRAIKELEDSLGITIFNRTSHGMTITPEGEEFLVYAHKILEQVDAVEAIYRSKKHDKKKFKISVPRASYISAALSEFTKELDKDKSYEIYYKETNSARTITNILQNDYKLGIIRYQQTFESYFENMLSDKGLDGKLITEFSYRLLVNKESPLAKLEVVNPEDLSGYVEIAHSDPYVPSMSYIDVMKKELVDYSDKRIYVFERASQFELMANNIDTFMWVSPVQKSLLDRYNLIEIKCDFYDRIYKDVLIYKKGYSFSDIDNLFIDKLIELKKAVMNG